MKIDCVWDDGIIQPRTSTVQMSKGNGKDLATLTTSASPYKSFCQKPHVLNGNAVNIVVVRECSAPDRLRLPPMLPLRKKQLSSQHIWREEPLATVATGESSLPARDRTQRDSGATLDETDTDAVTVAVSNRKETGRRVSGSKAIRKLFGGSDYIGAGALAGLMTSSGGYNFGRRPVGRLRGHGLSKKASLLLPRKNSSKGTTKRRSPSFSSDENHSSLWTHDDFPLRKNASCSNAMQAEELLLKSFGVKSTREKNSTNPLKPQVSLPIVCVNSGRSAFEFAEIKSKAADLLSDFDYKPAGVGVNTVFEVRANNTTFNIKNESTIKPHSDDEKEHGKKKNNISADDASAVATTGISRALVVMSMTHRTKGYYFSLLAPIA
jgi:hypothetical protein